MPDMSLHWGEHWVHIRASEKYWNLPFKSPHFQRKPNLLQIHPLDIISISLVLEGKYPSYRPISIDVKSIVTNCSKYPIQMGMIIFLLILLVQNYRFIQIERPSFDFNFLQIIIRLFSLSVKLGLTYSRLP